MIITNFNKNLEKIFFDDFGIKKYIIVNIELYNKVVIITFNNPRTSCSDRFTYSIKTVVNLRTHEDDIKC